MESAITISNHVNLAFSLSRNPSLSTKNSAGISCIKWQRPCLRNLGHVRLNQQRKGTRRKSTLVQAVAVPVAQPSAFPPTDNTEHLKQLAERYGFQQIGEPLPDDVTMRDIITSLPKQVFEINDTKAWGTVLISVTSYALGIFMIAKAPWYLLPLAWAWTGTAITGFFVIGHDCAHKSFSKNKLVEDIVGTLAFMPLIYPYEPWRFKHDQHHAKTNMLREDTAWLPIMKEDIESSPGLRKALIYAYGPLRTWMSIAHWLKVHFNLKNFRQSEVKRATISLAAVFAFMVIGWPLIIYKTGIVGWIKFWLMPWLGYHFWMSTFTIVHHTAPHIPFKSSKEWNAAQAQLSGTVHCDYPRWIEILCHDISVHIPHHISPKIPSYNLRAANQSLNENWGKYLNKAKWNWRLMRTIMTTCHIYDKDENYVSFEKAVPEESQPISFLKRVMPDYA
ncbi:omega-6 fatty acid desaturase, chloroplastic [Spinacia oleracea]|uniref:Omega-6 fatty acid desaturase, chloroplastic n=1 Tax=Spinacia oleracea TaxID=3562 RepID=A0ABM2BIM0_SPIOL|nr:omega-6 fatty acid desaturase, chloroplastic [Spinacia oleracea]